MYLEFFGLEEAPFNVNPTPRYLYWTPELRETLAGLVYCVSNRRGFATLIGEVGTGKTTLLNRLLECLSQRPVKTAFIFNSQVTSPELLEFILSEFHIHSESNSKIQQLVKLHEWLLQRYEAGESVVLIVDEAQNLTHAVLEEIRLLTNLETPEAKLLQVILSGQPELDEKLNLPELRQLRQRITVQCKTSPLSRKQTHEYIAERLRVAGAHGGPIFPANVMDVIYKYARGIPRLINLLCEHALVHGYAEGQRSIELSVVEKIAQEFKLDESAPAEPRTLTVAQEVYSSGSFVQDFGQALSQFRMKPIARG